MPDACRIIELPKISDPRGNLTSYGYDPVFHQFVVTSTNPLQQVSTATWDIVCGQPLTKTDLNQQVVSFTYDAFCRITRQAHRRDLELRR